MGHCLGGSITSFNFGFTLYSPLDFLPYAGRFPGVVHEKNSKRPLLAGELARQPVLQLLQDTGVLLVPGATWSFCLSHFPPDPAGLGRMGILGRGCTWFGLFLVQGHHYAQPWWESCCLQGSLGGLELGFLAWLLDMGVLSKQFASHYFHIPALRTFDKADIK